MKFTRYKVKWWSDLMLLVLILCIFGCEKSPCFRVLTDISGKEIYSANELYHYVVENGEKKEIIVTRDDQLCRITNVKINEEGVIALAIYVWEGETFANKPMGEKVNLHNMVKSNHYILFVSQEMRLKYKAVSDWISDMNWIDNASISVQTSNGQLVVKNPLN